MTVRIFSGCILFLFLAALWPLKTLAQHDFDRDGHTDTLDFENLEYIDGATGDYYYLGKWGGYSEFLGFIGIPEGLKDYPSLLDSLEQRVLGNLESSPISPAEEWLLKAYDTYQDIKHPEIKRTIRVDPTWYEWPAEFPSAVYQLVPSDKYNLPHVEYQKEEMPPFSEGWLIYYGHNHRHFDKSREKREFIPVGTAGDYEILRTSHGLIAKNEDQYAWIFHSNGSLTGGPSKLRWPSIQQVWTHEKYILIHHAAPVLEQHRMFFIRLEDWSITELRIKYDFMNSSLDCFKVTLEDTFLMISAEESCDNIAMEQIFELSDFLDD